MEIKQLNLDWLNRVLGQLSVYFSKFIRIYALLSNQLNSTEYQKA